MTALVTDAEVTPASLLPEKEAPKGASGLDRIGQRYAPGLGRVASRSVEQISGILQKFGLEDVNVEAGEVDVTSFADWSEKSRNGSVVFHYRAQPISGGIIAAVPAELLNQLVDIHFGGTGENAKASADFSPAEHLFLGRFAEDFTPLLTQAWADMAKLQPNLQAIVTDGEDSGLFKPHELIAVQSFSVGVEEKVTVSLIYPVSGLRAIPAMTDVDGLASSPTIDPVWYDKLNSAVMQVRFPMRTIFARPEISLQQLMNLKTGDVIPIFMPNRIPLSVAGRLFAHGTVGDSNNRIAVKIEEIEEGKRL